MSWESDLRSRAWASSSVSGDNAYFLGGILCDGFQGTLAYWVIVTGNKVLGHDYPSVASGANTCHFSQLILKSNMAMGQGKANQKALSTLRENPSQEGAIFSDTQAKAVWEDGSILGPPSLSPDRCLRACE